MSEDQRPTLLLHTLLRLHNSQIHLSKISDERKAGRALSSDIDFAMVVETRDIDLESKAQCGLVASGYLAFLHCPYNDNSLV